MDKSSDHERTTRKIEERRAKGADWRRQVPLGALAEWTPPQSRRDPIEVLIEQGEHRIPELLPERYKRMKADAFAFLRGAAAIMAADLAAGPSTGLRVQACGDCHLANFGAYATPEGTAVFDVNDFDETLPAPFEWDVKRLATSFALAGRAASQPDKTCRTVARTVALAYRLHLVELLRLPPLEAWRSVIRIGDVLAHIEDPKLRNREERRL